MWDRLMHNCILTGWQVLFPLIQHRCRGTMWQQWRSGFWKKWNQYMHITHGSCFWNPELVYDGDQHRYAQIAGHGFCILAEAMEKDLPYEIKCPSLLICGTKDHAGSCIRYNREWHRKTKIPLKWIEGAGHNSNTDKPEMINSLLEEFFSNILWQAT